MDRLREARPPADDRLSSWVVFHLLSAEDKTFDTMLEAAMTRRYSASPREPFFAGGGMHWFSNFAVKDNVRSLTVREAFKRSVNLVFIRMMRDIVCYYLYNGPKASPGVLTDREDPRRERYLVRFADEKRKQFLAGSVVRDIDRIIGRPARRPGRACRHYSQRWPTQPHHADQRHALWRGDTLRDSP